MKFFSGNLPKPTQTEDLFYLAVKPDVLQRYDGTFKRLAEAYTGDVEVDLRDIIYEQALMLFQEVFVDAKGEKFPQCQTIEDNTEPCLLYTSPSPRD